MKTIHTIKSSEFVRPFADSKRKSFDGPILVTQDGTPVGVYVCMRDWNEINKPNVKNQDKQESKQ